MSEDRCDNTHCTQHDDVFLVNKPYLNHLKNWEEWRAKRKKLFCKLYRKTGRKPGELVLNYGEEFRKVQEERTRMEYARINTNFDKYRGNPEFWLLPTKLKDKGYEDPQYFAFQTSPEKNIIPPVVRIATPEYFMRRKKIFPLLRSIYTKWSSSKYRQNQLKVLEDKLKEIEPHIPDPSQLFVIGKRLVEKSVEKTIDETVQASMCSLDRVLNSCFELNKISRLSLNINDKNLLSTDDVTVVCPKIKYFFHYSDLKTPIRETLTMTNNGRSTVRIIWRKMEKYSLFKKEMNMNNISDTCFYFGKQEIIIRPGKTEEIPLWFLPKKHGVYTEKWTIQTIPKISEDVFDVVVIFQSATQDDKFRKFEQRIKENIENGVRNTMIKECLADLMNIFRYTETSPKICHISQRQLFECRNLKEIFGLRKPAYKFKESNIKKLRQFYTEIKEPGDPVLEDLSIEELKLITRRADVIDYIKKQERIYSRLKFVKEEVDLNTQRKLCINTELIWGSELSLSTEKLKDVLSNFETPIMIPNNEREKHVIAFNVFRAYFIRMCNILEQNDDPDFIDDCIPCLGFNFFNRNIPLRWAEETFDDIWIPKSKFITPISQNIPMNPKPAYLQGIPPENIEELYTAYFGLKVTRKSAREKSLISQSSQCTESDNAIIKSAFGISLPTSGPTISFKSNQVHEPYLNDFYNYNRYILVYTTLQNAIDAMINAVETYKENYVEDYILEEVLETGQNQYFKKQKLDLKSFPEGGSENTYYNYLLETILLKNENVIEYIVKGKLIDRDEDSFHDNSGSKLKNAVSRRLQNATDKYKDLFSNNEL